MTMKNSIYTIGNRTRDLPACSAVPQPTALSRAPVSSIGDLNCRLITLKEFVYVKVSAVTERYILVLSATETRRTTDWTR